jgi:catechol 2,3-dioxygenase
MMADDSRGAKEEALRHPAHPIAAGTRIGHVHLQVADVERSLDFYCGVLGFHLTYRLGDQAAFVAAGNYHHHIGLNSWESRGGPPPPKGTAGLAHLCILYPTRAGLADAVRRLRGAGIPILGGTDYGASEAVYIRDPDDHGIELCWDRPRKQWPHVTDDQIMTMIHDLDIDKLLAEEAPLT